MGVFLTREVTGGLRVFHKRNREKMLSQDKADAIKIQTDHATILDDRRKDGQDHHSLLVVSVYRL